MEKIIIFTDGASRGNPGHGGWGAVLIQNENSQSKVESEKYKVFELGGREDYTTNNRMELMAAIEAISFVQSLKLTGHDLELLVHTDSSYLINGITKWVSGWERNGWMTKAKEEVLNRDLWEKLSALCTMYRTEWKYVGGHVGIVGNERCDEIATSFADNINIDLYQGPIENYSVKNILDINFDELKAKEKSSSKNRSSKPAFSYLSMIDGKIEKHTTWGECEARVKGKSGAKFKKALSASEEKEIIESWK
jgi:ribonuclease HI